MTGHIIHIFTAIVNKLTIELYFLVFKHDLANLINRSLRDFTIID